MHQQQNTSDTAKTRNRIKSQQRSAISPPKWRHSLATAALKMIQPDVHNYSVQTVVFAQPEGFP